MSNLERIKKEGGPAFPLATNEQFTWGMSLRDHFAGQALVGLLAFSPADIEGQYDPDDAARIAYRMADAMLAARDKSA